MRLLEELNEEQRLAVTETEGQMLILAGAGSGKTRVITYRIAYLIATGLAQPEQILAVTFTNKAADEMRGRILALLDREGLAIGGRSPWISTFHSLCVRILRQHIELLGDDAPARTRDFSIYDSEDQRRLVRTCLARLGFGENSISSAYIASLISLAKNRTGYSGEIIPFGSASAVADDVRKLYEEELRRANALDFDDLILYSVRLLSQVEEARGYYRRKFRYLLVDEYQDTNRPQYELIRLLAGERGNLCVVGDEDQSIYRFRGADIQNILEFERDYPDARIVKLERNYRSTKTILRAAGSLVSFNQMRKGKTLWTENPAGEKIEYLEAESARDEAEFVARRIEGELRRGSSRSTAVLYRANFQSRQFEEVFRRYGISYRIVGEVSFYSRAEIKDIVAYLRAALNPHDSAALFRIIGTPPRGIGDATIEMLAEIAGQGQLSLWRAIEVALARDETPRRTRAALLEFYQLIKRLGEAARSLPPSQLIPHVVRETRYLEMLQGQPDSEARIANIEELISAAAEGEQRGESITQLLDRASLASETDDLDPSARVQLMTLHSAKGLEFDVVFLAGMEEGLLPHSQSLADESQLEEERRLCYVGMTRARKRLCLTWAKFRRQFGINEASPLGANRRSRFLDEIPAELLEPVNAIGAAPPSPAPLAGKTYNTVEGVRAFLEQKGARFLPGTLVRHPDFGEGQVLSREKQGGDFKLTVRFFNHGVKRLVERYAKLERI